MTKNSSLIASVLGTWTAQLSMTTDIGDYGFEAHLVMHIVCDPMKQYSCSLEECNEIENKMCAKPIHNVKADNECMGIENNIADWSDVMMFATGGGAAIIGEKRIEMSLNNGWVGPYSMIAAQNTSKISNDTLKPSKNEDTIIDHYALRYVISPSTPYLRMPLNQTLIENEMQFGAYFGTSAVAHTVQLQATIDGSDPYAKYLGTCDNGDVQPVLPNLEFSFIEDKKAEGGMNIKIVLNYKIFMWVTADKPLLPFALNQMKKLGFPISGPYCYENKLSGYTVDLHYDSNNNGALIKLDQGCVEGFPCTAPGASFCTEINEVVKKKEIEPTVIKLGLILYLFIALCICGVGLTVALVKLWKNNEKMKKMQRQIRESTIESELQPDRSDLSEKLI